MNRNFSDDHLQFRSFFQHNRYEELVNYLEELLLSDSDNYIFNTYLSCAYLCLGEISYSNTISLNLLLDNNSDLDLYYIAEIIFNLADLKFSQQDYPIALSLYQQGLEFNPDYIEASLNLARILTYQGDIDSAITIYQDLIYSQPNLIIPYQKLGLLWQNIKDYHSAIELYQQALNLNNSNTEILINLSFCLIKTNQLNSAKQCLEKVIKLNNQQIKEAYGELGYIFMLENSLNEGVKYWQELLKLDDKITTKYLTWCDVTLKGRRNNLLIKVNSNFFKSLLVNNLTDLSKNLGDLCYRVKLYHQAIFNYQIALKSIDNQQELEEIYSNLILASFHTGNKENIKQYLELLSNINNYQAQKIINLITVLPEKYYQFTTNNKITNYYESTLQWVQTKDELQDNYYSFELDNIINLQPPKTLNNQIHPSFYFPAKMFLPAPFLVKIPQGRFYLREDEASSAVITENGYLIGDLSPESPALSPNHPDSHPKHHSLLKNRILSPVTNIRGTVVVLTGLLNNIYFHWLFDILPRIHLLELAKIHLDKIDYFLVDNRTNFQRETLNILNIPSEKIIKLSFPTHIQADKLIVPSFPGAIAWMPLWSCDFLREKILGNKLKEKVINNRRIYISRNKCNNRRLINEDEIIEFLQGYNFEVVTLENLSVKQQAELMYEAEIVISPHGSGLSNLVFCQRNTKVIEIFATNYVYPCYWLVSNLVKLDYYYLVGETIGSKHFHQLCYPDCRFEDIYVNLDDFKKIFSSLC